MKGYTYPHPSRTEVDERGNKRRVPVRGSTWTFAFAVQQGDKRKQVTKRGFPTKRAAEAALREALTVYERGERIEPSKMTVRTFLVDEWLPQMRLALKPSTFDSYEAIVTGRLVPHLGDTRLTDLTAGQVARCYTALRTTGNRRGKNPGTTGLSEKSVRNTHIVLHKALRDATRARMIHRNPADDIAKPKQAPGPETTIWTAAQLQAFLAATEGDRWHVAWHLALATGLRRGELVGLRWSDLNLDAGFLSVRQSATKTNGVVVIGTPKSKAGLRAVSIDPGTVAVLRRWRKRQREERLAWGAAWTDSGHVVTREDGLMVDPEGLAWWFEKALRTVDVPAIRFHDLRHTHASQWLAAGRDMFLLQRRLGHHSITVTADRYGHLVPGQQEEAAALVAAAMFGTAP